MLYSSHKRISAFVIASFLTTFWQFSSEAQPWKILKPDPGQPSGAPAKDKLKIKIVEPESYPSDPLDSDIDIVALKRKLGRSFKSEYVALTKDEFVVRKHNATREDDLMRKMLVKSMPEEIKSLDFKMPGMKRYLGAKASKKLQLWLWQVSYCSVLQKWRDLGVRFWPRYINVGRCSKKTTCSFPSGMKCRIWKTKPVAMLRWHCLDREAQRKETTCVWLKFHYPVITECKCSCSQ